MSTENLSREDAKKKYKKLTEDIKVAMMVTDLDKRPLSAIPMTTKKVDESGDTWFLSLRDSEHNQNILHQNQVQLLYSEPSDMEFLSVFGTAEITSDKKILKDLYDKSTDTWFEGTDDPQLTAIKFSPTEAYYWDKKSNKFITLYKMGAAAVTGKDKDIGEKGRLEL